MLIRMTIEAAVRRADPSVLLIPEMGVAQGFARIDLAVIGGELIGYEIKGALDDLGRLPRQIAAFGRVFDRLTLVTVERHVRPASRHLPWWWGIAVIDDDTRQVCAIRPAELSPERDIRELVALLWRDEAIDLLVAETGLRRRGTRRVLQEELVAVTPPEELATRVRECLRQRSTWRVVA